MNRVLITGASGFVGSSLVPYLEKKGLDVVSVNLRTEFPNLENKDISAFIHLAGKAHDLKNSSEESEYFHVNLNLTKIVFEKFLLSNANTFVFLSSVKAVADFVDGQLTEDVAPNPITIYGKSKLEAEKYLLSHNLKDDKRIFIIRPCMIHGPGNKGNLNLLYSLVSKGIPWPLGSFENKRSFCSVENLCFVIHEFIEREDIQDGVYNVADDDDLSTNELVEMMSNVMNKRPAIILVPKRLVNWIARLGDYTGFMLNSERLQKLTESYTVSNSKLLKALGRKLPIQSKDGLKVTLNSFSNK